jgi:alkylation response protein AidB-like acyl-CoA dehydrogenase
MEFRFTADEDAFRTRVRDFLGGWVGPNGQVASERFDDLEREMAAQNWLTIAWPAEYGGGGASPLQQLIFKEECWRAGVSLDSQGVNLLGPSLMVHGSEEQKREHLPRIASGEVRWAQGFSEPGAGSDLASLQTRAVRDGDDYIINGQKIWTSGAHLADWIHLLARTDPDASKHRGISYFMINLRSPGITIRPLIQLTGVHGFNEVFFDDVRVPRRNMISEENRGWYAATTTLDFERSGIERNLVAQRDWRRLYEFAASNRAALVNRPATWRHRMADLRIEVEVGQWIARRVAWMQGRGLVPNYESSMSKTYNSEVGQRIAEFGVSLLGLPGQLREPEREPGQTIAFRYLDARRLTVGQGTSEINRNVIATRGLGLPRG